MRLGEPTFLKVALMYLVIAAIFFGLQTLSYKMQRVVPIGYGTDFSRDQLCPACVVGNENSMRP